jgi:DNA-binding CsgD family transcriptional regulator
VPDSFTFSGQEIAMAHLESTGKPPLNTTGQRAGVTGAKSASGSRADKELRKTGIDILGDMPWGTHFCMFYETKEDLLDIVVPYFETGLENNEFCLMVMSKDLPLTAQDARSALRQAIPKLEQHETAGRIEFISHDEWFLQGGDFDVPKVIGLLRDKLVQALARGQVGLRVNGSPAWILRERWKDFRVFERTVEEAITDQPIIAACSFPLATSGAAEMLAAARTHQFTILRRDGVWEKIQISDAPKMLHSLTPRELQVLTWVTRGKSAWEIGKILNAVRKFGAANRIQAVAIALLYGLIDIDASNR